VLGKCLEVPDRDIIDRMRKKETVCSDRTYNDLLGTFCMDEEVFLLLCMEGSFVLLPTGDLVTVVDIRNHVTLVGSLFATWFASSKLKQWNLFAFHCNKMLTGGASRVQVRDPCSLTVVTISS